MNLELKHRLLVEITISLLLLVFYGYLFFFSEVLIEAPLFATLDPSFFPKTIAASVVGFCFLLVLESFKMWHYFQCHKLTHQMRTLVTDHEDVPLIRVAMYVGTLFLYLIGFYYIGFLYSTPLVIVFVALLLGMKNIFLGIVSAIVFTVALDYASLHLLQIMLPKGILFS